MKNVIMFVNEGCGVVGRRLQKAIEAVVSIEYLEILKSTKELSKRLNRFPNGIDIAVLLAENEDRLSELLSLRDFLKDVRVILILPNRERETISKGHVLLPRLLTYTDEDFVDIAVVLGKMVGGSNR